MWSRGRDLAVVDALGLDAVLMQLGGLAVQPSHNKTTNPLHACLVASWVVAWLPRVAKVIAGAGAGSLAAAE